MIRAKAAIVFIRTSMTLRVVSPYVFSGKNYEFSNRGKKRYNFETAHGINLKFRTKMGHIWIVLRAILEALTHVIRVSKPKTEMPVGGLNNSGSKTNRTRRIKVSNLEASGHAVSAPKNKPWRFWHIFFLSFFMYLLSKLLSGDKNSETTKARNLKFGQMISLYMKLCICNFEGTTSRGLGLMHPKLVIAKFIKWFTHPRARAAVAEWLKAPVRET